MRASASSMPMGTEPSKTRICSTFGISLRMRSNSGANSASTNTIVASQWSVTYAASSADSR